MSLVTACLGALAIAVAAQGGDPTVTTLSAAPGGPGAEVTVSVAGGTSPPTGTVTILDDGRALAVLPLDGGTATLGTAALDTASAHTLTAVYGGDGGNAASTSVPVAVGTPEAPTTAAASGGIAVTLTIPSGSLSITSQTVPVALPWSFGRVVTTRATVADTRAGNLGFTVSLALARPGGSIALATGLHAEQVPGNGLQATDVRVTPAGLAVARHPFAVATYPPGLGLGSVGLSGTITSLVPVRVVWTVI
jgi:hypothetical protein